jgi:flagellar FliL protein
MSPAPAAAKVGLAAILIPVVINTVLTLGTVGGLAFWFVKSGKLGGVTAGTTAPPTGSIVKPPPSHVVVLEPMIVNLADGRSYLRAGVSVRLRDQDKAGQGNEAAKDSKAVDEASVALRDTTLTILSGATADVLLAPGGRDALKKLLASAYKMHNEESHVMDVYFTEFLVQRG